MATTAAEADVSQTHPYTCNSCSVAFRNSDAQRNHMRSDWHRYNLKRRIADLPPVSVEDYNDKVLAAQATNKAAAEQASFVRSCAACQKTYYSENAYQNHIASKSHRVKVKAVSGETSSIQSSELSTKEPQSESNIEDAEAEREFENVVAGMKDTSLHESSSNRPGIVRRPSAPAPDAIPPKEHPMSPEKAVPVSVPLSRCLFCNYDSPTWKLSVNHMTRIHGLFVPEQTYLVDMEGMLTYLQSKIYRNFECISCHKLRGTLDGVQTHMRDKGHCKIAFETDEEMLEIGQFYDFSSTYSDVEEEDSDAQMEEVKPSANGGVKLPNAEGQNDGEHGDEGWETDSSFSSLDSAELTSVPIDDRSEAYQRLPLHRHHSQDAPRIHRHVDGFHSHAHHHNNAVFYDEHEMHLPSGRVAGHRNLRRYYQQNLHSYPSPAERMERAQKLLEEGEGEGDVDEEMADADAEQVHTQGSALIRRDEAGMLGVTAAQRRQVEAQEFKSRRKEQRTQNRYQAKVEKQANSQKHFRDPLLQ